MKTINRILFAVGLLLTGSLYFSPAWAEGSRSLYPSTYPGTTTCGTGVNQGCRANLDIQPSQSYVGKIKRLTFLYVYAQANEYILLGSRNRNNGGDIYIYNPQDFGIPGNETIPVTKNFTCSTSNSPPTSYGGGTKGYIATRAEELAGPKSADGTTGGANTFVPCAYRAPSTGIYGVYFTFATSGASGPDGVIDPPNIGSNSVSAWDVTVRASATSTTDINGRVFTYAWAAFTGSNGKPVFSTHYYVTSDGYRYSETLGGLDPNGYVLYANSLGFLDNGQPLYKDLRGSEALVTTLPVGVTTQIAQYPFFFSDVSPSGANNTEVERVLTALNIPLTPPSPTVSSVSFAGHVPSTLHSTTGAGGTFSFSTTDTITYQIVISRDGSDFSPQNTNNAVLTGIAATGSHTVTWDGKDNAGVNFPSSLDPYSFRVYGRAGEVHFPIIDAENNGNGATKAAATFGGGPTITRLNGTNSGDKTVYFDDRGYITNSGTLVGVLNGTLCNTGTPAGPNPNVSLDGVPSTLIYGASPSLYRWWVPGTYNGNGNANADCAIDSSSRPASWGDAKGLNLWTYYSTTPQTNTLYIDPVTYDGATSVSAPTTATAGSTVQGAFTFANNGTGTATGVTYAMDIGTGCTPSITFNNLPSGASAGSCSVVSGKGRYIFTGMPASLTAGQAVVGATATTPMTFSYTAPATGPVVVTTTIAISEADDYAGNNSDTASTGIGANDVQTTVSVPATANAGDTVNGNFQFANYGASAAVGWAYTAIIGSPGSCPSGVTLTSLPTGVTLNNYNTSTCATTFTGLPTNLAAGQSFNFGFSYTAPSSGTVPVNTTVSATSDANATNNASNGSTAIAPSTFTVSGTVFNDNGQPTGTAGNGLKDGTETGTNAGELYALLVNGSGDVVAHASVAANGAFSFSSIVAGNYTVRLSSVDASSGAAPAAGLPVGWMNTGESINGTSTDGTADGDLAITVASADRTTLTLGIRQAVPDVYTTVEAPPSVAAGDPVTTLLTFGNQGDAAAEGVTYAVTLPQNLTGLSCTDATCDYNPTTGALTITGLPTILMPGQTQQVVVHYSAPAAGPLMVTALIQATGDNGTTDNNTDTASTTVSSSVVDVAAWLNAPAEATTGSTVTVPVNFTNLGGVQATGVTYTLTLPTGLTNVACTGSGISCSYAGTTVTITGLPGNLDPGQTVGLTLSYTAPVSTSSPVTVTATVNATQDSGVAGNNSASGSTVINATATAPDVISTVAPPATAAAGSTVTVPVTYANLGPDAATVTAYNLTLSGTAPTHVEIRNNGVLCTYASNVLSNCGLPSSLNPGQEVNLTLSYTAPANDGDTVIVTSTITVSESEANTANNPSTGSTTVSAASVPDVYTTVDVPATVPAGSTVHALLTFGNQGLAAVGGVSYAVTLPPNLSGVSCAGATCMYDSATGVLTLTGLSTSLSPGQSEVVQLSYIAPALGVASLTVQAQITTTTPGETPTNNNAAQASTTVTGSATADVTTWIDAPATANSGQTVNVLAGFTNLGTANATSVTYTLTGLPAGATVSYNGTACTYTPGTGVVTGCGLPTTLTPGQTVELVARYTAPATGPVVVTSTVGSTPVDSDTGNNSASASTAISATVVADVATTVAPPLTAPAGSTVTVPITYTNLGPASAAGVTYTLTLPAGLSSDVTCSGSGVSCSYAGTTVTITGLPDTLDPGQTVGLSLIYTAPANGTVSVTSKVNTTTDEGGHIANNSASGSTAITAAPTVDVYALVDAPATAVASSTVNVVLTFGNQSSATANSVSYSALLPAGLSDVSCTDATCAYDSASGLVTISGLSGTLTTGQKQTATLTYTAPATTGTVPVTARISDTEDPGFGGNNSASDSTVITAAPSRLDFTAQPLCLRDTPYVDYNVVPIGVDAPNGVTLTWFKADGSIAQTLSNQPLSGRLLWPGAAVDASGNPTAWPGWSFVNGQWVRISDGLRPTLRLVATVNPTAEKILSYPPATAQCSANPPVNQGASPASIPTLSPAALLGLITMLLWLLRSTTRARCAPLGGKRRDR